MKDRSKKSRTKKERKGNMTKFMPKSKKIISNIVTKEGFTILKECLTEKAIGQV